MILGLLQGLKSNIAIAVVVVIVTLAAATGILTKKVLKLRHENGLIQATLNQKVQDVKDLNSELRNLRKETQRVDKIITKSQLNLEKIQQDKSKQDLKLREVYEREQPSREWRDSSVPKPVTDILLNL